MKLSVVCIIIFILIINVIVVVLFNLIITLLSMPILVQYII